jgi:hypothetical protein
VDLDERSAWAADRAATRKVVRYALTAPALFIPIDGNNRELLGLRGAQRRFAGYEPYQLAAHALYNRFGRVVHGLSWESFHRNQPGRVYALWHHHKATTGLKITSEQPYKTLIEDEEWQLFLNANPDIIRLEPPAS